MKKILLVIIYFLFSLFAFSQYNPTLWQVDNQTNQVTAITGLIPANGFDVNSEDKNIRATAQYSYEWVGVNRDILKITFVNTTTPNYDAIEINLVEWIGNALDSKFINDQNGNPNPSHQIAKGTSVNLSDFDNATVSFDVIAEQNINIRVDCQSIDGKVTNYSELSVPIVSTSNINLSDNSQWRRVSYSWGDDGVADAYINAMYDYYSPKWYNVPNPHELQEPIPLTDSAITGLFFIFDNGMHATGTTDDPITKVVYIKNITIGKYMPVEFKDFVFSVPQSTIEVTGTTTNTEFTFNTDSSWTISSNVPWITFSQTSGTANPTINILTTENSGSNRTGEITINSGGYSKIVTLVQYSNSIELYANQSSVTIGKDYNNQTSFTLYSKDVNWEALYDSTWIHISESSGTVNGLKTIVVTTKGNPYTASRSTPITFSGQGVEDVVVTVVQEAGPGNIPIESVSFTLPFKSILINEEFSPTYTVNPTYTTINLVNWKSTNNTIAVVDETGKVTGISKGAVFIIVSAIQDSTICDTLQMIVNEQKAVIEIQSEAGIMPMGLMYYYLQSVRELTIHGTINQNDMSYINGMLGNLDILDLHDVTIESSYNYNSTYLYPANEIPENMFKSPPYKTWKEVILPDNLITINSEAFSGGNTLETVVLPSTLQYIGDNAFLNCSNLSEIELTQDPRNITVASNAFTGVDKQHCILRVPQGMKSLYEADDIWKDFIIIEITDEQTNIVNNTNTICLYPNPVSNYIIVSGIHNFNYSIINSTGAVLLQNQTASFIEVANLPNGVYTIIISKNGKTYNLSFVK